MSRSQAVSALKTKLDAQRIPSLEIVAPPVKMAQELFLQIGHKRYQVASIEQAVAMHNEARDRAEHGASGMPRVTIVNAQGTHLYGISYNGRVWTGLPSEEGSLPLDGMNDAQWTAHVTGAV